LTSDDIGDENAEVESATSSDALFENRNVWLKGMRGMVQHLSADAEQVVRVHALLFPTPSTANQSFRFSFVSALLIYSAAQRQRMDPTP
jgi:hypothetical protein